MTKKDLVVNKKKVPSAKKKNNSKYNPNRARDERREELIYLRKKVSELETQLQAIRLKRPQLTAGGAGHQQSQYGGMTAHQQQQIQQHAVIPGVWQDVANHQCEERLKSERENIRLKLVLENQIKIAKTLEKFLHKTTSTKEVEKCVGGNRLHHMYPPTIERTDAEIFEDLLAGADQAYAEVDAVFESNGLAHIETTHSDARMRSDGAKGMCLEMFANKVLPFDMHSTGTAAWHHFVFAKQRTPSRFYNYNSPKNADATEDTIVENFTLGLHANSTSLHMSVKQVLRRYIDENRVVVIWRSMFDPVEFSDEPLSGVRFHETGYIVVQRPSTASDNYSLVKTCYIFTPNFSGDAKSGIQHKVGAITDFMLSATAANITSTHQMIENVLLEQVMRKSGHI
uniref:START domain-containing protein n=1 Tax=Globisporangium ultimum (strain ATCC 200006 / CBS 805.95 / DAOM BR144) TaxID=431595 RepID=K3W8U8_GLOUD